MITVVRMEVQKFFTLTSNLERLLILTTLWICAKWLVTITLLQLIRTSRNGWRLLIWTNFFFAPGGDLKERLKGFEQYPGVAVNEVFFGSNGHETRPSGGVLLNYTKRRKTPDKHIKSIVQPAHTLCPAGNPHSFFYTGGQPVNEKKEPCLSPFNEPGSADLFRINHYWVKSKEEYKVKLTRGRADVPSRDPKFRYTTGLGRKLDDVFMQDNEVHDTDIWAIGERTWIKKIKIISGWSKEGGSTFSLMELCDLFNERGYDCTVLWSTPMALK